MKTPNLEVCFLLKRGTWGPTPPQQKTNVECFYTPKLAEVDAPKKDGTPVAVPTGAINFGEPGTNGTGSPIFGRLREDIYQLIGKKTVWEGGALWWNLTNQATV